MRGQCYCEVCIQDKFWLHLPTQLGHEWGPRLLNLIRPLIRPGPAEFRPLNWRGLHFRNPVGTAGGLDKNACYLDLWQDMGAGFLEIGTVTPLSQSPNPGRILKRDVHTKSLWNQMGFPNHGASSLKERLAHWKNKKIPVFVSLGKNRGTENERASQDYVSAMESIGDSADAFVVNVSSPNTKGLRELQAKEPLLELIAGLLTKRNSLKLGTPLLLKLSPDLGLAELESLLGATDEAGVDGWIMGNTTSTRTPGSDFPLSGGASGGALKELARKNLVHAQKILSSRRDKLLISVGGILEPSEVKWRLDQGADLVQIYSALVFWGPFFFRDCQSYFNS